MSDRPLRTAPIELAEIQAQTESLVLPHFTSDDAFDIGVGLRKRIRCLYPDIPCVINITGTNSDNLLFHCTTAAGVQPDNDVWVSRKRTTVKRWGVSTWYMHHKMGANEEAFKNKYALGDAAGQYAIHGGGVPVRVHNVDGVIAVIVVSGLKQDQDHQIVVEALEEFLSSAK